MIKEEERSMELDGPPIKKRKISDPHQINHSECNKEPQATRCPADILNQEVVVKQDEPFNNGKESLTEGSQIESFDLEQESHTNKDIIEMEAKESLMEVSQTESKMDEVKESLMEVSQTESKIDEVKESLMEVSQTESKIDEVKESLMEVSQTESKIDETKESLMEVAQTESKMDEVKESVEVSQTESKIDETKESLMEVAQTESKMDEVKESLMEFAQTESKMDEVKESLMEVAQTESKMDEVKESLMEVSQTESKNDEAKESGSQVKNKDNGHQDFQKKLLVLDVNGLLVDIVVDPDETYRPDTIIGSKAVFKRPYCDEFLKFCFERFNVGVWTSRTRRNIERVLDFLIKDTQHQLLFCWDQSHCTETGFNTIENSDKPLVLKELKKLWEKQDPDLPWDKGVYNESNTFLLDDSPYKALRNPPYTAIFPYTYSYRNTKDKGLGREGDLRLYLERLAESDNVQKFIEQNPFGQQPITINNKSWKFYHEVIGATSSDFISPSRKKLLVIDINGLLTDVAKLPIRGYRADLIQGNRAVFKRPYCDEFLKFCFEKFNVGVWSSTNRRNTEGVLDFLMRDTQHQLYFCWDQYDCRDTGFGTVENINKPLVLKELRRLWEKKDSNLPWDRGDYDESNTLLLEITPSKALLNPRHTAIFPHPYRFWKTDDNYLGPDGELRIYLERLAESENVQKFVEKNPFGQRPISSKNLSWGYYQKVIRATSSRSEAETLIASYLPRKLETEADTVTATAAPTNLEPETDTVMTSDVPNKSEPEADTVTVTAAPPKLEPEADTVMTSDAPIKLEPETDTNTASVSETVSKSETDSAAPIKLEQETETNSVMSSGLPNKLELKAESTLSSAGQTLVDLTPANGNISLETVNNGS